MLEITGVDARTESTVWANISGAPETDATYRKYSFLPDRALIRYAYRPTTGTDGWVRHDWVVASAEVSGPRVLKPATDGSQRLGKDRGHRRWYSYDLDKVPDWVFQLIEQLRPSGSVDLAV